MINRDYNITFLFFFIDVSTFTIEKKFCTITVEWIYYFFSGFYATQHVLLWKTYTFVVPSSCTWIIIVSPRTTNARFIHKVYDFSKE